MPSNDQTTTPDPREIAASLSQHARVAVMESAHGLTAMLGRDVPPALWVHACRCGGLCDSTGPCPMGGEQRHLNDLGRAVAAVLAEGAVTSG